MEVCSKRKVEKELIDFYKSSRNKSGYRIQRISCDKKYTEVNKDSRKEYDKKYRQHSKENLQPLCSKINRDIKKNNLEYVN